jgi:hypothetical protein
LNRSISYWITGAWLIHIVLIIVGKIIVDNLPGISQQISWTLVNLLYLAVRSQFFLRNILFSEAFSIRLVDISDVPLGHWDPIRESWRSL